MNYYFGIGKNATSSSSWQARRIKICGVWRHVHVPITWSLDDMVTSPCTLSVRITCNPKTILFTPLERYNGVHQKEHPHVFDIFNGLILRLRIKG